VKSYGLQRRGEMFEGMMMVTVNIFFKDCHLYFLMLGNLIEQQKILEIFSEIDD